MLHLWQMAKTYMSNQLLVCMCMDAPFPPNNWFIFMLSFRLTTKTYFSTELFAGGCGRGGLVVGAASGVCVLSCESHTTIYTESVKREGEREGVGGVRMQDMWTTPHKRDRARAHTYTHTHIRTDTRAHTHTHTHARTHTRRHAHTATQTLALSRTHTHTHTRTHARTHTARTYGGREMMMMMS